MKLIKQWFDRQFSDPQVIILLFLVALGFVIVIFFGEFLAPLLTSIVIAYLLEGPVRFLERRRIRRLVAVILVFVVFLSFFLFSVFTLLPLLLRQVTEFFQNLPTLISQFQDYLLQLPKIYPSLVSQREVEELIGRSRGEIVTFGQRLVSLSVASLVNVVVYLVLVPFLVFFLLKDKRQILAWLGELLPRNRELGARVWKDVDRQIGRYLRGKIWEILIVWGASAATFALLGLNVPVLLGLMVGLSVLIPYIGAAGMTVPVALVGYVQWGFGSELLSVMIAYAIIQAVDGNLLAPLLLSEVVDLHPVGLIAAILLFGGLWGFWGLFFAVPLAMLVRAILEAWPRFDRPGILEPGLREPEQHPTEAAAK